MHKQTGSLIDVSLRDTPLDVKDWHRLLELTARRLRPHLGSMSLPTLGESIRIHFHPLSEDLRPDTNTNRRGIWTQPKKLFLDRAGVLQAVGLDMAGNWVRVNVPYVGEYRGTAQLEYRATGCQVQEANLCSIAETGISPLELWTDIQTHVGRWSQHRQELAATARTIEQELDIIRAFITLY